MGIRATRPWNISYCVLGPSIDFIGGWVGGAHSGAPLTFLWNLLGKKKRRRKPTHCNSQQVHSPKFSASLQAGCPNSPLIWLLCVLSWFTEICSKLGRASQRAEPPGTGSLPSPQDQHMASGDYRVRLIAPRSHGRSIMSPDFSMLTPNPVMPARSNFPSILPHGRDPHWAAVCKRHLGRFLARAPALRGRVPTGPGSLLCSSQEHLPFRRTGGGPTATTISS